MDQTFDAECHATACNYDAALLQEAVHRIDITLLGHGQSGPCYQIVYAGQILVERAKEPLTEACRALLALGHVGRLEMWGGEAYPRMIVRGIEQAAKLTVVENVNAGPRFAQYRPHPGDTEAIAVFPSAQRAAFDSSKSLSTQESKRPSLRGPHSFVALS